MFDYGHDISYSKIGLAGSQVFGWFTISQKLGVFFTLVAMSMA